MVWRLVLDWVVSGAIGAVACKSVLLALTKAYQFAIRIVKAYRYLCEEKREFVLSKQWNI